MSPKLLSWLLGIFEISCVVNGNALNLQTGLCAGEIDRGMGYYSDEWTTYVRSFTCLARTQIASNSYVDRFDGIDFYLQTNVEGRVLRFDLTQNFYINHGPAENKRFQPQPATANYWDRITNLNSNNRFYDLTTMGTALARAFPQGTTGQRDQVVGGYWLDGCFYAPNSNYNYGFYPDRGQWIAFTLRDGFVEHAEWPPR